MRKFSSIANLIKTKRLSHPQGLSQSDLSHLLGYKNGQFISNVERALCNIPFKMMNKVCDILHITPLEIKSAMIADYSDTIEAYFESNEGFAKPAHDLGSNNGLNQNIQNENHLNTSSNSFGFFNNQNNNQSNQNNSTNQASPFFSENNRTLN